MEQILAARRTERVDCGLVRAGDRAGDHQRKGREGFSDEAIRHVRQVGNFKELEAIVDQMSG